MKGEVSRIEVNTLEIISLMIRKLNISYDEAERRFKSSVTYELMALSMGEFGNKNSLELFQAWLDEQEMNSYVASKWLFLHKDTNEESRGSIYMIKKLALLEQICIEDAWTQFYSGQYDKILANYTRKGYAHTRKKDRSF